MHYIDRLRASDHVSSRAAAPPRAAGLIGLKANASNLPPDQLDKLDHLDEGKPEVFAELRNDYGLRVLGDCCGTDDRHIRAIASGLRGDRASSVRRA